MQTRGNSQRNNNDEERRGHTVYINADGQNPKCVGFFTILQNNRSEEFVASLEDPEKLKHLLESGKVELRPYGSRGDDDMSDVEALFG